MTVKELKKVLTRLMREGHGSAEIMMEGCDCDAPCMGVGVKTYTGGSVVYLER